MGKYANIDRQMREWGLAGQPLDPNDPFFAKPAPVLIWTPERVKDLLATNDKAVGRALIALLQRQTRQEQDTATTTESNGRGFGAFDAEIMTSMAMFYQRTKFLTPNQLRWLRDCPGKQKTTRIGKYAGQLAAIANGAK